MRTTAIGSGLRGPMLAACGVALLLHGVAGWGLAGLFETGGRRSSAVPNMTVRMLPAAARPLASAAADAAPPGATGTFDPAPAALPAAMPAPTQPEGRAPDFLTSDEVDEPAHPVSAWTLDADALAGLGITRVVFDTWVDAQASLVKLQVVSMEPPSLQPLAPMIEARLAGTPMVAALKQGRPVAHVQRIELGWERVRGLAGG